MDIIFKDDFCFDKRLRILKSAFPDKKIEEMKTKEKVKKFITQELAKLEDLDQPSVASSGPRGYSKADRLNLSRY